MTDGRRSHAFEVHSRPLPTSLSLALAGEGVGGDVACFVFFCFVFVFWMLFLFCFVFCLIACLPVLAWVKRGGGGGGGGGGCFVLFWIRSFWFGLVWFTYANRSRWSTGHQRPPVIVLCSGLLLSFLFGLVWGFVVVVLFF